MKRWYIPMAALSIAAATVATVGALTLTAGDAPYDSELDRVGVQPEIQCTRPELCPSSIASGTSGSGADSEGFPAATVADDGEDPLVVYLPRDDAETLSPKTAGGLSRPAVDASPASSYEPVGRGKGDGKPYTALAESWEPARQVGPMSTPIDYEPDGRPATPPRFVHQEEVSIEEADGVLDGSGTVHSDEGIDPDECSLMHNIHGCFKAHPPAWDAEVPINEYMPVLGLAIFDLRARPGLENVGDIKLSDLKRVSWPDGSLGNPQPGVAYATMIVEGFRMVLEAGGESYVYHTSTGTAVFVDPDAAPEAPTA